MPVWSWDNTTKSCARWVYSGDCQVATFSEVWNGVVSVERAREMLQTDRSKLATPSRTVQV